VEAFNATACTTPDPLSFEDLLADYEASRFFGIGVAIAFRLLFLYDDMKLPSAGEQVTEEMFDQEYINREQQKIVNAIANRMKNEPEVKEMLMELAEDLVQLMDEVKII
jgi:hypothetical protein